MATTPKGPFGARALATAEYLAQNAYVAPGFHRLFTAAGLSLGLWGGRRVMDIVVAHRSDGTEVTPEQVPALLRPLYGKMRYRQYSDDPSDRWKFVADRFVPIAFGALGAWAGSTYYGYGRDFKGKAFHGLSANTTAKYEAGEMSLQVADQMVRMKQADSVRKLAAGSFTISSTAGTHLFGAGAPWSNGGPSAISFQLMNGKKINTGIRAVNEKLFGNFTHGSNSLQPAMAETARWMEANLITHGHPEKWLTDGMLARHARDALQNFHNVTPQMEQDVAKGLRQLLESAHGKMTALRAAGKTEKEVTEAVYAHVTGQYAPAGNNPQAHFGLLGRAFDNLLHHHGVPLQQAVIGESKWFTPYARMIGSGPAEREVEKRYADYLKREFNIDYGPQRLVLSPWKATAAWAGLGLGTAGLVTAGGITAARMSKRLSRTYEDSHTSHVDGTGEIRRKHQLAEIIESDKQAHRHEESGHGFRHWVNGTPLDVAQWAARITVTAPSMHRLMNAAYLSAALYGGMKFANVLAGRDLKLVTSKAMTNSLIAKEETWKLFQPLHGALAYTPGSINTADRWKQALHYLIPVGFGAAGTYTGSAMFFRDRFKKLDTPQTLEDYTDRISAEQSKVYGAFTAVTSIFNSGSGLHMAPFVSYSSNMHNRFMMGNGQQVAMPLIGKWWSGNAGLTPWGVKRSLAYTTKYLAYNDAPRPRELPALVHSIIGKLYPTLDEQQLLEKKQVILNRIYEVRDSYLVDGKVPQAQQAALFDTMQKLLGGEGLEHLLLLAGLDPAKADLAANGASGRIANFFGKGHTVHALEQQYRDRFAARTRNEGDAASVNYIHALADRPNTRIDGNSAESEKLLGAERVTRRA